MLGSHYHRSKHGGNKRDDSSKVPLIFDDKQISPVYDHHDIRFFPFEQYQQNAELVVEHRTWGRNIEYWSQFQHLIVSNEGGYSMTYLRNHNDGLHNCMGTTKKDAVILFDATVSYWFIMKSSLEDQAKMKFQIEIGYLHSWDQSYIGDVECRLLEKRVGESDVRGPPVPNVNPVKIVGHMHNGGPVHDSTPRNTMAFSVVGAGKMKGFLIECRSLLEDRLACFTKVSIYYDSSSSSSTV